VCVAGTGLGHGPPYVGEYGLGDRHEETGYIPHAHAQISSLMFCQLPANQAPGVPPLPLTAAESDWNSKKNGVGSLALGTLALQRQQQRPFGIYQTPDKVPWPPKPIGRPGGSSALRTAALGGSRMCEFTGGGWGWG
jgi:hypothetical protein